ncbi:IclR family transcriptional regulator [Pseudooceanicola algae]|uniref:Pca regulon regulatory protein n=1 Tax=Pseudooceanicola algae TaxID=1537215 RepID=A0A418SJZ7_9RHOB|nr:IclR family transcriptional regulator C-terminal domain-containing protein [Pseudooceanicola algae]QPM92243.1 Pca regulon regulatory protein [Pseudooceanicola algae]
MADQSDDRYLVPGLIRGLSVLKLFTPDSPSLSLSDIARALGITRSAAFRTVYTLNEAGCLLHDQRSQTYALGPGVLRLTYGYVATREVVEIAQPALEQLRDRIGWSAHLGVLDGASVLYVLRVPGPQRDSSIVQVGSRLPARATTMGRVLLADLGEDDLIGLFRNDHARGKGPSLPGILRQATADRAAQAVVHTGDFEAGMVSAAAPLRDMTGQVVAAINVTAPQSATTQAQVGGDIRAALIATAARISVLLGWDQPARIPVAE